MTVVVAFLCSDGVVIAADSMITPSIGTTNAGQVSTGHHKGQKIHVVSGPQLLAWAGDVGQANRFQVKADSLGPLIAGQAHPLDHALLLSQELVDQFISTGIQNNIGVQAVIAYEHGGQAHCCAYLSNVQPWLLDQSQFFVALGSGKLSADPFLRFLYDVFCQGQQPTVQEAVFLATWTVQYTIETNPGGVAGPIKVGVMERNAGGQWAAREISEDAIREHEEAIEDAYQALRDWRDNLQAPEPDEDVPAKPEPPAA